MRRLTVLLAAMAAVIVLVNGMALSQTAPSVSPTYTIQDLGPPPRSVGTFGSTAFDVNDLGEVVGTATVPDIPAPTRAFLYTGGQMRDLGTLGNEFFRSEARGINASGQVVGAAIKDRPPGDEFPQHAFLTAPGGGQMEDIGTLPGGDFSEATDVNASGQVVGSSATSSNINDQHAFLYSGGEMQDLGTLGGDRSWADGINDRGQVVGQARTSNGELHAFLTAPGGGQMQNIGTMLPGVFYSTALDINESGQVVGYYGSSHYSYGRAFLYSEETGQMEDIGTLPGGDFSEATDINDRGQVVGISGAGISGSYHPFLYSEKTGQMEDLYDLLPADSGWDLGAPFGINSSGQIVGSGSHNGNAPRAYLASPEPLTTPPTLNLPTDITELAQGPEGAPVTYQASATDEVDGPNVPVRCTKGDPPVAVNSGDTFPIGTTTVNCNATDRAGNVANGSFKVTVAYDFGGDGSTGAGGGFRAPLDNPPTLNEVKAGAMVPVKFSLGGNYGTAIFAEGSPISKQITCDSQDPVNPVVVPTETNAVGLRYDETAGQYVYNWKTSSAWSNTCRQLVFTFKDDSEHPVNFKFK